MADGSQGLGGVLFEAGKSAFKATGDSSKKSGQTLFQDVKSQASGNQPPASQKPPPFKQMPFTNMPKAPGKTDFGQFFGETGGVNKQAQQVKQQQSQQQQAMLDQQAQVQQAEDQRKIEELRKKLHEEIYFSKIRDTGKTLDAQREEKSRIEAEEEERKKEESKSKVMENVVLPGGKTRQSAVGNLQIVRKGSKETPRASG